MAKYLEQFHDVYKLLFKNMCSVLMSFVQFLKNILFWLLFVRKDFRIELNKKSNTYAWIKKFTIHKTRRIILTWIFPSKITSQPGNVFD